MRWQDLGTLVAVLHVKSQSKVCSSLACALLTLSMGGQKLAG